MSNEIRHMQTIIRLKEDEIIRCKNYAKIEKLQSELMKLRWELTKKMRSLT